MEWSKAFKKSVKDTLELIIGLSLAVIIGVLILISVTFPIIIGGYYHSDWFLLLYLPLFYFIIVIVNKFELLKTRKK